MEEKLKKEVEWFIKDYANEGNDDPPDKHAAKFKLCKVIISIED